MLSRLWCGQTCRDRPDEARVGDIAVEVAHSGFYTRAQV